MTLEGRVLNGTIVLTTPAALPEGACVRVEILTAEAPDATLFDRLGDLAGKAANLPPDASSQHDHYLYERAEIIMTPLFADTSYFLALLGPADQYHRQALAWSRALRRPLLTTEYVVLEVGNSLIRGADRALFVAFLARLHADTRTEVVPTAAEWLDAGMGLFAARSDQTWSLTDCISFSVMTRRKLTDALTAGRHFEQAGFRALLLHEPDAPGGTVE